MKSLKPIRVEKFTRLTELEMKNVFGGDGSGNDGPQPPGGGTNPQGKCLENTKCSATYYVSGEVAATRYGSCRTHTTQVTGASGATVTAYYCDCDLIPINMAGAEPSATSPTTVYQTCPTY